METSNNNECHFKLDNVEICSTDETIVKISQALDIEPSDNRLISSPLLKDIKSKIIKNAKEKTDCDSESCIYTDMLVKTELGKSTVENELKSRFKPGGPFDNDTWLDNRNIDSVLKQNMEKYKNFYAIPFQMIECHVFMKFPTFCLAPSMSIL